MTAGSDSTTAIVEGVAVAIVLIIVVAVVAIAALVLKNRRLATKTAEKLSPPRARMLVVCAHTLGGCYIMRMRNLNNIFLFFLFYFFCFLF